MYSSNVDGIISGADSVIAACVSAIESLCGDIAQRLKCDDDEQPKPFSLDLGAISSASTGMATNVSGAQSIGDSVYCGASGYNTSSGSPWTEINRMNEVAGFVSGMATSLKYVGEKAAALAALNMLLSCAVDAKQAVIAFHDSLSRGFDSMVNDNKPSITWRNSVKGTRTTGNINTPGSNNVHIEEESIDPY